MGREIIKFVARTYKLLKAHIWTAVTGMANFYPPDLGHHDAIDAVDDLQYIVANPSNSLLYCKSIEGT